MTKLIDVTASSRPSRSVGADPPVKSGTTSRSGTSATSWKSRIPIARRPAGVPVCPHSVSRFEDEHGRTERHGRSEQCRRRPVQSTRGQHPRHGHGHERHLHAAADNQVTAQRDQFVERELQADGEQEQKDARLGEVPDLFAALAHLDQPRTRHEPLRRRCSRSTPARAAACTPRRTRVQPQGSPTDRGPGGRSSGRRK